MVALAALGKALAKYLVKALLTDPKGVLKFLVYAILLPLVILLILFVAPLGLFTHIPLVKSDEQQLYFDVIREIQKETGVQLNISELVGIDAILLKQNFQSASKEAIRKLAWEFIDSKEETRTRTVEVACKNDPKKKCKEKETYEVTVYSAIPFDKVLNNLVAEGKITIESVEDIKRYMATNAGDGTKIDMDNLPVITDGVFMRPATGRVSSGFGSRWGRQHLGVDIGGGGRTGVPIVAAADGIIKNSQIMDSFGEMVCITHNINGQLIETVYAHMVTGSRQVSVGQRVTKGQVLGIMGDTGRSTATHLHFEIHIGPRTAGGPNATDPMRYVQF
jgi:murein DD-endopeptidase MepM/ murein hydrolase activator NlpD